MRKIRSNFIQPTCSKSVEILLDHVLEIEEGTIKCLRGWDASRDTDAEDKRGHVIMPGMIDLHVHLSQWDMRGSFEPALLPWLEKHVFPAEMRSSDNKFAASIARRFFDGLFACGTTMAVVYTAPYEQACDIAFEVARDAGVRVFMGMTMMDANSPKGLLQSTEDAYVSSVGLYSKWDSATDRLRYIFTPRFAPTCTMQLMRRIGDFAADHKAWVQSHLSENMDEIKWVREIFGMNSYTEVYAKAGLLSPRTLMAHAIHLDQNELDILAESATSLVHCPDSNLFLKSGEFPYQRISEMGINVGIGSDVGAGTTLNMLYHAKMANYRQNKYTLMPDYLLWNITLGNAGLLNMDGRIGSLDIGKEADICIMRIPNDWPIDNTLPSKMVFCSNEMEVTETAIAGSTVYKALHRG